MIPYATVWPTVHENWKSLPEVLMCCYLWQEPTVVMDITYTNTAVKFNLPPI